MFAVVSQASSVDHLPAWLAFAGATVVALIAAVTAQLRLRTQLAHERQLHDLAELREILDSCGKAMAELSQAFAQISGAVATHVGPREKISLLGSATRRTLSEKARLQVRLGTEHEITKTYDTCIDSYVRSAFDGLSLEIAGDMDGAKAKWNEGSATWEKAHIRFVTEAQRRAGTKDSSRPEA